MKSCFPDNLFHQLDMHIDYLIDLLDADDELMQSIWPWPCPMVMRSATHAEAEFAEHNKSLHGDPRFGFH